MQWFLFVSSILSIAILCLSVKIDKEYIFQYVDYIWDTEEQKQETISSGDYDISSCVIFDIDEAKDGRIFVTLEKDMGVPASLTTISNETGEGGPLLRPYPNWSWHQKNDCTGITGVYQISIKCHYLFVMDCGKITTDVFCPPQLLIFDLSTDELVKKVKFPFDVAFNTKGKGVLMTFTIFAPDCKDLLNSAIVYIADPTGYALVIWNARSSEFCRIESIYLEAVDTNFTIGNQSFFIPDGIFGLTIIKEDLFLTLLGGHKVYKVKISDLQCPRSIDDFNEVIQQTGILSGQTAAISSKDCAIFFSSIPDTSLMCADTAKEINSDTAVVIAKDPEKLQFLMGLKVANNKLWVISNKYQKFVNNNFKLANTNETNFRILSIKKVEIMKQTPCFDSCYYG